MPKNPAGKLLDFVKPKSVRVSPVMCNCNEFCEQNVFMSANTCSQRPSKEDVSYTTSKSLKDTLANVSNRRMRSNN